METVTGQPIKKIEFFRCPAKSKTPTRVDILPNARGSRFRMGPNSDIRPRHSACLRTMNKRTEILCRCRNIKKVKHSISDLKHFFLKISTSEQHTATNLVNLFYYPTGFV